MNNQQSQQGAEGMGPRDILMILFRNKWKIILFALLGVGAAALVYVKSEPPYESTAKVYVKYLIKSGPLLDPAGGQSVTATDSNGRNIFGTEFEIIQSWDLSMKVADRVGPLVVLDEVPETNAVAAAAVTVRKGITVGMPSGSSVISIGYKHRKPEVAVRVLETVVEEYLTSHSETHNSLGSADALVRTIELKKSEMEGLEQRLIKLKFDLGITTTLDETRTHYQQLVGETESSILSGKADLALLEAQLTEDQKDTLSAAGADESIKIVPQIDESTVSRYRDLNVQLSHFRKEELDLLGQYTPENPRMKRVLESIDRIEKELRLLEENSPGLLVSSAANKLSEGNRAVAKEGNGVASQVIGARTRLRLLEDELARFNQLLRDLNAKEGDVRQLERDLEIAEISYARNRSQLETHQFDQQLDPGEGSAIRMVQHPSIPTQDNKSRIKKSGMALFFFAAIGVGLALAREFIFDQSIQSPLDVESKLQLPLFMTIPKLADQRPIKLLANGDGGKPGVTNVRRQMPWEVSHFIRPYCEALRDRLIMYFQLKNLHHKPKLVAVTSCSDGAGATTLSAGLAASLSETGDGKVLLVDMNVGRPEMHPFFRGSLANSLSDLLQPGIESGHGEKKNLYIATASEQNGKVAPLGPAKFYELLPKLKSSDFDYIIFDMPPIKQTSSTVALSGLMDKVLLVVEPGKTNRDAVKRAAELMRQQHADVAGVVNRMPKSAARWLEPELA